MAEEMLADHPGIPSEEVAIELVETFMRVMRKRLLKYGEVPLEGIGTLHITHFAGRVMRNRYTKERYQTPPRSVVKFKPTIPMRKLANMVGKNPPAATPENNT